jgi:DNA polymerase III subunit gamma/tau
MSTTEGFKALYNKYRPQLFSEVVGQKHIVRILQNSLAHNRVSHAYLFSGERGTGKTTVARLLAKAINCLEGIQPEPCNRCANCLQVGSASFIDLIEIDAASNTSVDDIRDLREKVRFRPSTARYKVYIIDEVHQLSRSAYNAFLKTLEEPPDHAIFILATTDPHRVLATIRSRCQHLRFRRHTHADTVEALGRIAEGEGTVVAVEALHLIARNADGSLRDAIGLLDQAIAFVDESLTEQDVRDMLGLTGTEASEALAAAIAGGDAGEAMRRVNQAVQDGNNPASMQQELVNYFRALLLVKTGRREQNEMNFAEGEIEAMEPVADRFGLGQLVRCLELLGESGSFGRAGQSAQLELELALVHACLMMGGDAAATATAPAAAASPARVAPTTPAPVVEATRAAEPPAEPPAGAPGAASAEAGAAPTAVAVAVDVARPAGPAAETAADAGAEAGQAEGAKKRAEPAAGTPGALAAELAARGDQLRDELRAWSPAYEPYVSNGRWHDEDGTLVLTPKFASHYDSLARAESKDRVAKIVAKVLGKPVRIRISSGDGSPKVVGGDPRTDTLIQAAVTIYGAELVDDE